MNSCENVLWGSFCLLDGRTYIRPKDTISNWHPRDSAEVWEDEDGQLVEAEVPHKDLGYSICECSNSQVPPITAASTPSLCLYTHAVMGSKCMCPSEVPSESVLCKPAGLRRVRSWSWVEAGLIGPLSTTQDVHSVASLPITLLEVKRWQILDSYAISGPWYSLD